MDCKKRKIFVASSTHVSRDTIKAALKIIASQFVGYELFTVDNFSTMYYANNCISECEAFVLVTADEPLEYISRGDVSRPVYEQWKIAAKYGITMYSVYNSKMFTSEGLDKYDKALSKEAKYAKLIWGTHYSKVLFASDITIEFPEELKLDQSAAIDHMQSLRLQMKEIVAERVGVPMSFSSAMESCKNNTLPKNFILVVRRRRGK